MENAQLSLLNALFGKKAPGDAFAPGKPIASDGTTQSGPDGFLSFLQGLVTTAPQADEETLNAAPATAEQSPLHGLNLDALKEHHFEPLQDQTGEDAVPLEGLAPDLTQPPVDAASVERMWAAPLQRELGAPEAQPVAVQAPVIAIQDPTVAAPITDVEPETAALGPVTPLTVSAAMAEPLRPAAEGVGQTTAVATAASMLARPGGEIAEARGAEPATLAASENAAFKTAADSAPAQMTNPAVAQAQVAQAQVAQAQVAQSPNAVTSEAALSEETAPEEVAELELEPRAEPDHPRQQIKTPGLADNRHAKAVAAITEHAAPEALAHSALTRDDSVEAAAASDRFTSVRLEAVAHSANQNAHFNPVRDQIVAAVAARPGETRIEIRLDPPELGRVMIGFDRDGTDIVRAVVTAESPDTLDLMRRNADVLHRALDEQGFSGLDLEFAHGNAGEGAPEDASDNAQMFSITEEEIAVVAASAQSTGLVNGRLDRRL